MLYLLDIHHKPPMVVLTTASEAEIAEVGQRYADQVGRPLVVVSGPAPDKPHFSPTIPTVQPVEVANGAWPQNVAPPPPTKPAYWDDVAAGDPVLK
jgi:hypothetical protein